MSALSVAKEVAKHLGVPVKDLTVNMIKNSKLPVRFKKLVQGVTSGEKKISPAIKSSRTLAAQEVKAGAKGIGVGASFSEGARLVALAAKKVGSSKNKTGVTQGRNRPRTPVNRAIDSAKKSKPPITTEKVIRPPKKPSKKLAPKKSLRPKARP